MSLLTRSNSCGVSSIIIHILSSHFFSSFYMVWICYGFIGGPNPLPASFASRYLRVHFLGSMHSCIHTYLHCFCIFKAQLGRSLPVQPSCQRVLHEVTVWLPGRLSYGCALHPAPSRSAFHIASMCWSSTVLYSSYWLKRSAPSKVVIVGKLKVLLHSHCCHISLFSLLY